MSSHTQSYEGKFAVSVARCSSEEMARTTPTIDKQLEMIRLFASSKGITIVDEIRLEGLSASSGQHLPELTKLIGRKEAKNDYEVLLFTDYSRFARNIRDGRQFANEFEDAGVEIVTVKEGSFSGKYGWLHQDLTLFQNQAYAECLSFNMCGGFTKAVNDGRITPINNCIYGVDKFYIAADGQKLFILRDLHDGRKVKLHHQSLEILEVIVKRRGERAVMKRKSDIIKFLPGAADAAQVVRDIFRWRFVEGKNPYQIAKALNMKGIAAMKGGRWGSTVISQMLRSPIYTGTAIGNRRSTGTLGMRGTQSPVMHQTPRRKPKGRKTMPEIRRPRKDWHIVPVPEMENFLEPAVHEIAKKWQWDQIMSKEEKRVANPVNSAGRKSGGNRHDPNAFPLTGIMRASQGGYLMKGWSTPGKKPKGGRRYRYYIVGPLFYNPMPGDVGRKTISAPTVETIILEALGETFSEAAGLEEKISTHIARCTKDRIQDRHELPTLEAQRTAKKDEYRSLVELPPQGQGIFKLKINQLELELNFLDHRIKTANAEVAATPEDAGEIAKVVQAQFTQLVAIAAERTVKCMRKLMEVFVFRCDADLETKNVALELALPGWALSKEKRILEKFGLVSASIGSGFHQTKSLEPLILAKYQLSYSRTLIPFKGSAVSYARQRLPLD
jgi:DNA invertase Pin-like site-specific DNA recombinase